MIPKIIDHYQTTQQKQTMTQLKNNWKISKKNLLIEDKITKRLITQNARASRFHIKFNIQKEEIPGKAVISSVSCNSSNKLEYFYYHLLPIVGEIPSYIKDTSDFLRKLKTITEVPEDSYLVTLDVKSLYTSIQNSEGI